MTIALWCVVIALVVNAGLLFSIYKLLYKLAKQFGVEPYYFENRYL